MIRALSSNRPLFRDWRSTTEPPCPPEQGLPIAPLFPVAFTLATLWRLSARPSPFRIALGASILLHGLALLFFSKSSPPLKPQGPVVFDIEVVPQKELPSPSGNPAEK